MRMRFLIIIIFVLWTTARHEGSHAIMAYLEGAEIKEIQLLPGIHKDLGFYFGYVEHSEETTWLTEAAPFFSDILLIIFTSLFLLLKKKIKYYNEILLFGFISPIIDLIYNYQGGLWRKGTDVADVLIALPNFIVHLVFISVIIISILGFLFFRKRMKENYAS